MSPKEYKRRAELAFAACRSIRFAIANAQRYGGEYNLHDIEAAGRLATEALADAGPKWRVKQQPVTAT